ncbi:MAG: hypothetical protein K6G55_06585 [Selenomonadaceae bacterium]|nr:hypothetical protein [Selenomonadaceae bacterium]
MLVSMYNQKSAGGVANIEFNDAKIREILTPKRETEKIRNTRRQVPLLMERYDEKVKKNENPSSIAKQIINIRKEAVSYVTRPTTIMSIYLDGINRKVEAINQKLLPAMTSGDNANTIRNLEEKLTPLDYEHAVYAVPNFTNMRSG